MLAKDHTELPGPLLTVALALLPVSKKEHRAVLTLAPGVDPRTCWKREVTLLKGKIFKGKIWSLRLLVDQTDFNLGVLSGPLGLLPREFCARVFGV